MTKQYLIKLSQEDDIKILTMILQSYQTRFLADAGKYNDILLATDRILDACKIIEETNTLASIIPTQKPKIRKPIGHGSVLPNLCPTHQGYGAKQIPRSECLTCWEAYERLNGTEATKQARRKFERKHSTTLTSNTYMQKKSKDT